VDRPITLPHVTRITGRDEIGRPVRPALCNWNHMIFRQCLIGQLRAAPATAPAVVGHASQPLFNRMSSLQAATFALLSGVLLSILVNILAIESFLLCATISTTLAHIRVVALMILCQPRVASINVCLTPHSNMLRALYLPLNGWSFAVVTQAVSFMQCASHFCVIGIKALANRANHYAECMVSLSAVDAESISQSPFIGYGRHRVVLCK
jgi:hypothetical protein